MEYRKALPRLIALSFSQYRPYPEFGCTRLFYPMFHRPESFRTILSRTIFLSSVKVATESRRRRRRAGHADL